MKKVFAWILLLTLLLAGCGGTAAEDANIVAATTKPVAEFTAAIAEGTDVMTALLVTESVSCLHDYTLTVEQMKTLELADAVVLSGAGLEDFMADTLKNKDAVIDASTGIPLSDGDPHYWLDPALAAQMAANIARELTVLYPQHEAVFSRNLAALQASFTELQTYGETELSQLSCRKLITFHDGFRYFADAFGLEILAAIEQEHGSEVPAKDLEAVMELIKTHQPPAICTEAYSSQTTAEMVAGTTGRGICGLDMCLGDRSYFTAMKKNIDNVKEAFS